MPSSILLDFDRRLVELIHKYRHFNPIAAIDEHLAALDDAADTLHPFALFLAWFAAAAALPEREAMTLATVSPDGQPDLRPVLLRGLDPTPGSEALIFFTNYDGHKGRALRHEPRCAALFYWGNLHTDLPFPARQVRFTGHAAPVSPALSDAYFAGRPRLSQLGAWASTQSEPVSPPGDRAALEAALTAVDARFPDDHPVPRPPHWGGFAITLDTIELWQRGQGRLHDRFHFTRAATPSGWQGRRLAP